MTRRFDRAEAIRASCAGLLGMVGCNLPVALGMLMWNLSVARIGSTRAGLLLFLEPLVGVTGGLTLLGEHFSAGDIAGGLLVMIGVVIAWLAGGGLVCQTAQGVRGVSGQEALSGGRM